MSKENRQLRDLVKVELTPVLKELGFQSTRNKPAQQRREDWWGWQYVRFRDPYFDLLSFQWDKNGKARFVVNFDTNQAVRLATSGTAAGVGQRLHSNHAPIRSTLFGPVWFGQWQTESAAIESAKVRLRELDLFLTGGVPNGTIPIFFAPHPSIERI